MTHDRETIIKLANDAELCQSIWIHDKDDEVVASVIRFAHLVAAAEREACAKVCETHAPTTTPAYVSYAAAIRARGHA